MSIKTDLKKAISFILLIVMIVGVAPYAFVQYEVGNNEVHGATAYGSDGIIVTTAAELNSAVTTNTGEYAGKTKIYLGSDITTSVTMATNSGKGSIEVIGTDPRQNGVRHVLTKTGAGPLFSVTYAQSRTDGYTLTVKDVDIYTTSAGGGLGVIIDNGHAGQRMETILDGVKGESRGWVRTTNGNVTFKDCNLRGGFEEFFQGARATFKGENHFQKVRYFTRTTPTTTQQAPETTSFCWIDGTNAWGDNGFYWEDYSKTYYNDYYDTSGSGTSSIYGLTRISSNSKMDFGQYSEFHFYGRNRFAMVDGWGGLTSAQLKQFTVGRNAAVNVLVEDYNWRAFNQSVIYASGPYSVMTGASLRIGIGSERVSAYNVYPIVLHNVAPLTIQSAKEVVFYQNGSYTTAIGTFPGTTNAYGANVNLVNAKSVNMYSNTSAYNYAYNQFSDTSNALTGEITARAISAPTKFWATKGLDDIFSSTGFNLSTRHQRTAAGQPVNTTGVNTDNYSGRPAAEYATGANATVNTGTYTFQGSRVIEFKGNYSEVPGGDPIIEKDIMVSGTGTPGSKILVLWPWQSLGDANPTVIDVASDGTWSTAVPTGHTLTAGQIVKLYQKELVNGELNDLSDPLEKEVLAKGVYVNGDNSSKVYLDPAQAEYHDFKIAFRNVTKAAITPQSAQYVIIPTGKLSDPTFNAEDGAAFDAAYASASAEQKGTLTKNEIIAMSGPGLTHTNGIVWVKGNMRIDEDSPNPHTAISTVTRDAFNIFTFKNIYEYEDVYVRSMDIENPGHIIHQYERATSPSAIYGIPVDADNSVLTDPTNGYDKVTLQMNPTYRNHWTATIGAYTVPFTLTLDSIYWTNGYGLSDGSTVDYYSLGCKRIPSMWTTVDAEYVGKTSGLPASINGSTKGSITVPLDSVGSNQSTHFLEYGGYYDPPFQGDNIPVGYSTGTAFTTSSVIDWLDFKVGFDPKFTNLNTEKLFVAYQAGQLLVQEKHVVSTSGIVNELSSRNTIMDETSPVAYNSTAPAYSGYVPYGYTITGTNGSDATYYFDAGAHMTANPGVLPNFNQNGLIGVHLPATAFSTGANNPTITYLYTTDTSNNGIPNDEEAMVGVHWKGFFVDAASGLDLKNVQSFYTRSGYPISVSNTGSLTDSGIANDKIVIASGYLQGNWLFDVDKAGNTPVKTITPISITRSAYATELDFDYAYSTDGINPDYKQFIMYSSNLLSQTDDINTDTGTVISGYEPQKRYVLSGASFEMYPPEIPGYVYVGYRYSEDAANTITYTNGEIPQLVSIKHNTLSASAYFLYKEEAATVNVYWLAETYAGNVFTKDAITYKGYVGEVITVNYDDVDVSSFILKPGESASQNVTFSATTQNIYFNIMENTTVTELTVKYESDDNLINYERMTPIAPNAERVTESAMSIPGYTYSHWELYDSQDQFQSSGSALSAVVNTSLGNQTLKFIYKAQTTVVFVRPFDEDGFELTVGTKAYRDAIIGQTYAAIAPYVTGYALADGEDVLKTIMVQSGTNEIRFSYERVTAAALVLCKETDTNGNIIMARQVPGLLSGDAIQIPDLSSAYYTALSTTPQNYNGSAYQEVEYYYQKDLKDITVAAVDANGDPVIIDGEPVTKVVTGARIGEMDKIMPIENIPGWSLNDMQFKNTYIDPGNNNQVVTFTYSQEKMAHVTVVHMNVTDNVPISVFTASAVVGSNFTADLANLSNEGFTPVSTTPSSVKITVDEDSSKNIITYNYRDNRNTVTTEFWIEDDGNVPYQYVSVPSLKVTDKVVSGAAYTATPKAVPNYVIYGYSINDAPIVTVSGIGSQDVLLASVSQDTNVKFYYKTVKTVIKENTAVISINAIDAASGNPFSSSVYKVLTTTGIKGQTETIHAPQINGYFASPSSISYNVTNDNYQSVDFTYYKSTASVKLVFVDSAGNVLFEHPLTYGPGTTLNQVLADSAAWSQDITYIPGWKPVTNYNNYKSASGFPVAGGSTSTITYELEKNFIAITVKYQFNGQDIATPKVITDAQINTTITLTPAAVAEYSPVDSYIAYHVTSQPNQEVIFNYTFDPYTTVGSVTFVVDNEAGQYVSGAAVSLGGITKYTNQYGVAVFANLYTTMTGVSYPYEITMDKYEKANGNARITSNYPHSTQLITLPNEKPTMLYIECIDQNGNTVYTTSYGVSSGAVMTIDAPIVSGYAINSQNPVTMTMVQGTNTLSFVYKSMFDFHGSYITGYGDGTVKPTGNLTRAEAATILYRTLVEDPQGTYTSNYPDVKPGSWCYEQVSELSHLGVITGYPDGTFKPNGQITRAEFTAMVTRFFTVGDTGASKFPDVKNTHWAKDNINFSADKGWVTGYPNGTFKPGNKVTRAEAITIINRVLERAPHKDGFFATIPVYQDLSTTYWAYAQIIEATTDHHYDKDLIINGSTYETWRYQ